MNTVASTHYFSRTKTEPRPSFRQRCAKAQPAGVAIGFAGGFLGGLAGLLLTAVAWFVADASAHARIARVAITLLVLMIPLLMLGASCLDSLEGNKSRGRSELNCDDDDDE